MKNSKVRILGTEYQILFRTSDEDRFLREMDGYVDSSVKEIVVSNEDPDCELKDFEAYQRRVLRHEIIHAFMEESGLSVNFEHKPIGRDETMVDWFAIQFPKIQEVFMEVGCL